MELEFGETLEASEAAKEHVVNLTFEEAAKGINLKMHTSLKCVCPKCQGSKGAMGYTWQVCVFCEGTGEKFSIKKHS